MPGAVLIDDVKRLAAGEPTRFEWRESGGPLKRRNLNGPETTKGKPSQINKQASSAPAAKQAARPASGRASQRDYRSKSGPSGGGRASVLASELEPGRKTLLGG